MKCRATEWQWLKMIGDDCQMRLHRSHLRASRLVFSKGPAEKNNPLRLHSNAYQICFLSVCYNFQADFYIEVSKILLCQWHEYIRLCTWGLVGLALLLNLPIGRWCESLLGQENVLSLMFFSKTKFALGYASLRLKGWHCEDLLPSLSVTCLNLRGLSPLNISIPPMWSVWATISLAVLQLDVTLYVSRKFCEEQPQNVTLYLLALAQSVNVFPKSG